MISSDRIIGEGRLLIYQIRETTQELELEIENPRTLADLQNIKREQNRLSFLAVRVALKKAFGEELYISYHPSGKPYLADCDLNISISHSKQWVAVFLHSKKEIGVDIQVFSEKIGRVYTRFLSSKELENMGEDDLMAKCLLAWSAKEALYKIIGEAAVDFRNSLEIQSFELQKKGELQVLHLPKRKNYTLFYEQNEAYTLAYCIE